jgi:hypothetical protein
VTRTDCDALGLLVVRLATPSLPESDFRWHRWDQATGAREHGLLTDIRSNSASKAPFKRTPIENGWGYFNAHIERVLFPAPGERGSRWLCCPDDLFVEFATTAGGARRRARIDLLERVTSPIDGGSTLGLIHLTLLPQEDADAPDTLRWARAITSLFRQHYERFELDLLRGDKRVDLAVRQPVRELVENVFGDPHAELERSLYTVLMAQCPPECRDDIELERDWRRALAKRRIEAAPPRADEPDESRREARQTLRLAGATGLMLGRSSAFTLCKPVDGEYARNLRSYWGESIVFGLMQQNSLEEFQRRLAAIGDPLNPAVQPLRRDWLRFRNLLWWSQLSGNTEVPQELLARVRHELGTERFFTDLEGDLATYSEQQQAAALANLQIYGAPFIVFGTLITAIGLFDPTEKLLAILVIASLLTATIAMLFVRTKLKDE